MNDEVVPLLNLREYFQSASDETLEKVVHRGQVAQFPAGSIVHEADVVLTTGGFLLRGRLKAVRVSTYGTESLFQMTQLHAPVVTRRRDPGGDDGGGSSGNAIGKHVHRLVSA
jgi:hypothetical protein